MKLPNQTQFSLDELVTALSSNKILLLHCDTTYGFVSRAPSTWELLQQIKGRPEKKPFLQLYHNLEQLEQSPWQVPEQRFLNYWPGAVTFIVSPKQDQESQTYLNATKPYCWQQSHAVRIPDHSLLQTLGRSINAPLYSSSANRSGQEVYQDAAQLLEEFQAEIEAGLILPHLSTGTAHASGLASTIIDLTQTPPTLLRQGAITVNLDT